MICPVCKKDTLIVEYKDIELDYCQVCHGVWFDAGELEMLLEAAGLEGHNGFLDSITHSTEAIVSERKYRCPVCLRKMKKVYIDEEKKIITDVCGGEHGIWFDGGEVNCLVKSLAEKSPEKAEYREVLGFIGEMFKYQA
jgi:Zn-finger nucleic acid-binding protein